MRTLLAGVALGALLPIVCADVGAWLARQRQRRRARNYLRRTAPSLVRWPQ